jgi:predicted nucleotidyltransferase
MLNREEILLVLKKYKPYFKEELGIRNIGLFGSYAKNTFTNDSDIDIVIDLPDANYKSMVTMLEILENKLGKKIDLIRKGPHIRASFLLTLEEETIYA